MRQIVLVLGACCIIKQKKIHVVSSSVDLVNYHMFSELVFKWLPLTCSLGELIGNSQGPSILENKPKKNILSHPPFTPFSRASSLPCFIGW
jgi:hypothetical protein